MNLNKLKLIILFFVSGNIFCAEKAPKLSAKKASKLSSEKAPTLKITDFFKPSKAKDDQETKLASLPIELKPKLGMALFSGKEINLFLASAVMNMQPGSQALMSLYDASHDEKKPFNPILQALYFQHKKSFALDAQAIVDEQNVVKNESFLKFNKFLKKVGCQVNVFDPLKSSENGLTICQKPASKSLDQKFYGSLHQKFYVFDKCLPSSSSSEKLPLAVITSHNPTWSAFTDGQQNDALVIALPNLINELKERFKIIKDRGTVEFTEPVEHFDCGISKKDCDFESTDFGSLNLHKLDSKQVELLASPLKTTDQSIIPKIVEEINQETKCIQIASFQFTHAKVVEALINALERGVRVECVLNYKQCLLTTTKSGANVGNLAVSRLIDAIHKYNNNSFVKVEKIKLLHHKFYAFQDRQTVITGSLNCSGNSEKNCAEVDVKIADQENYDAYNNYFAKLASTAQIPTLTNLESVHKSLIKSQDYSYKINGWKS